MTVRHRSLSEISLKSFYFEHDGRIGHRGPGADVRPQPAPRKPADAAPGAAFQDVASRQRDHGALCLDQRAVLAQHHPADMLDDAGRHPTSSCGRHRSSAHTADRCKRSRWHPTGSLTVGDAAAADLDGRTGVGIAALSDSRVKSMISGQIDNSYSRDRDAGLVGTQPS